MTTSCVSSSTVSPAMQTPSPGALLPSIVIYGARTRIRSFSLMMPATLKTTMRGPPASSASRKLSGPLSSRFFTTNTFPPRPPKLYIPPPCAGKRRDLRLRQITRFRRPRDVRLPFFLPLFDDRQRLLPGFVRMAIGIAFLFAPPPGARPPALEDIGRSPLEEYRAQNETSTNNCL